MNGLQEKYAISSEDMDSLRAEIDALLQDNVDVSITRCMYYRGWIHFKGGIGILCTFHHISNVFTLA